VIAALDPERREAFVLTQVLGLSYAEVAEICGCAVARFAPGFRAREDLTGALAGRTTLPGDRLQRLTAVDGPRQRLRACETQL